MREGVETVFGIRRPPTADGFAGDTEQVGYLAFGKAQFTTTQGTQAQGFENFIGQLACVGQGYRHDTLQLATRRPNYTREAEVNCREKKKRAILTKVRQRASLEAGDSHMAGQAAK